MPKAKPTASNPEADIATNQALLSHAEATRLAKSWLSASLGGATTSGATESDENEQEDIHALPEPKIISDTAGLGFVVDPNTTGSGRAESLATEKLRRQMLGSRVRHVPVGGGHAAAKPRVPAPKRAESDDEDEGRSALGKRKGAGSQQKGSGARATGSKSDGIADGEARSAPATAVAGISGKQTASKKRGSSYLDEILAGRSKKGKKGAAKRDGDASD